MLKNISKYVTLLQIYYYSWGDCGIFNLSFLKSNQVGGKTYITIYFEIVLIANEDKHESYRVQKNVTQNNKGDKDLI